LGALAAGRNQKEKAGPPVKTAGGKGGVYGDGPDTTEKQSGNGYVEEFLAALEKADF
jgi:hypothetical protein